MSLLSDICDHCGANKLVEITRPGTNRQVVVANEARYLLETNQVRNDAVMRVYCGHCFTLFHEDSIK